MKISHEYVCVCVVYVCNNNIIGQKHATGRVVPSIVIYSYIAPQVVWAGVIIKLHITTQSSPVMLIILRYSCLLPTEGDQCLLLRNS